MKVSVIIPSYNKGEFIAETFESLLKQSYKDIEIIVVDAVSTDETHDVLKAYKDDISQCIIEPDDGQSDAINKGIRHATGEIVGWLNADDLLFPNAIERIVKGFVNSPQIGVVYGSGEKIDLEGQVLKNIPFRPFNRRRLKQLFYILQPCMYFKRDLFLEVGGLNVDTHLAMDWELALKMMKKADFLAIHDKIAQLRMYEGTKTSQGGWETYKEIARIAREQNGILDVNYISFQARSFVSRVDVPVLRKLLRWSVESLCSALAGQDLYMICRWPESFEGEKSIN